jgi:hypothetical protein
LVGWKIFHEHIPDHKGEVSMNSQDSIYTEWLKNQVFEDIDTDKVRETVIRELRFLREMTVEEYTLYRKFQEIREKYSNLSKETISLIEKIKSHIWYPYNPEEYKKIEPVLVQTTGNARLNEEWTILRTMASTMINNTNIGRNLRFLVIDKRSGKYLGCLCLSSDFMDLSPRDTYIGWSREIKTGQKMINHLTIASSIIPTQPFGYLMTGGKLIALLSLSNVVEKAWNERYNDILVGVSTTSLYGSFSQYNSLKYYHKRGHTEGSVSYEPSKKTVSLIKSWLKRYHTRKYWEWFHGKKESGLPLKRDHKNRSLSFAYRKLGIDRNLVTTHHLRGIYFAPLFTNTREFLRKEIGENLLERKFDNRVPILVQLWKKKYAEKRMKSLLKQGRFSASQLFYYDIVNMATWEEVRNTYLRNVGRFRKDLKEEYQMVG